MSTHLAPALTRASVASLIFSTSEPAKASLTVLSALSTLSFSSPSGAPLSAHAVRMPISSWLRRRSLAKWPYWGSANHGGIFCASTAAFIALAQGRAS